MQLYVIRYSETEMGKNKVIATVQEPLNANEINQAISIRKELKNLNIDFSQCYRVEEEEIFYFNPFEFKEVI